MREKVLVIDTCEDCKYYSSPECALLNRDLTYNEIKYIPEDCPLEDKE